MSDSVERVRTALAAAGHPDTIDVFPDGTRTAQDAANAVGCAVALKNLDILEDGLLEHARAVSSHFQSRLKALEALPLVGEVRGMGLMACIECVADRTSNNPLTLDLEVGKRIDGHCQELGLLVRPIVNMCVMSPPLTITRAQIDDMAAILREGISRTMDDLEREGLWRR